MKFLIVIIVIIGLFRWFYRLKRTIQYFFGSQKNK